MKRAFIAFALAVLAIAAALIAPAATSKFSVNGTNSFNISERNWRDSMVPATAVVVGATAPSFADFNGGPAKAYLFQNNRDDTVYASVQFNHDIISTGSVTVEPHVHWCPTATTTAGTNVVWEIAWTWQSIGGVYSAYTTNYVTNAVSANFTHQISEFGHITQTNGISSIVTFRLRRLASSATADDFDKDLSFLGVDWHYMCDSIGSDTDNAKSF
jgi:hypothetical protein